jgi:enoyl-CoA hydratase/carnithine racemase
MNYETLNVTVEQGVARVELNRPHKRNAINRRMWDEVREAFRDLGEMPEVRVAILSGAGPHFTAGIDLEMLTSLLPEGQSQCPGRLREQLRRLILDLQDVALSIERRSKPVIAALHGICYGAAIDLATACDMRYSSDDARFSVKEIDVGLTADLGVLQRLPGLVGDGMARELAYTGREFSSSEAKEMGLVNRCFDTREALLEGVQDIARGIATKSPLSIRGCKEMLLYARDHSIADSLNFVATWNAAMVISDDLQEALNALGQKRPAKFRD